MQTVRIAPADPDDRGVADLLFTAIGGDRTRLAAATRRYRIDGSTELVAATIGDELVGVAGYETGHDHLVLLHLATAGTHRRTGIGRLLVADIGSRHPDLPVVAETDDTSVGFYAAIGFTGVPLGEKYPGVPRFRMTLGSDSARATAGPAADDAGTFRVIGG
ncbi:MULTISPECIES: GNAT family N-acetyltransferase [Nocardia]|uniref:GNAT family N-acetyltransferase n=1 Tax=Nocardia TaxID=1817 RepID=UPI000D688CDB|nr:MULTISPECIES: GNAT family N-acetyltransferase [Nocardia]